MSELIFVFFFLTGVIVWGVILYTIIKIWMQL